MQRTLHCGSRGRLDRAGSSYEGKPPLMSMYIYCSPLVPPAILSVLGTPNSHNPSLSKAQDVSSLMPQEEDKAKPSRLEVKPPIAGCSQTAGPLGMSA